MNLNQNQLKIEIKSIKKWYKNKNAVTGSNQWKFDNKIVKFQRNISFIFQTKIQWKVIIKSMKNQWNPDPILRENQWKSCTTPYSKFIENQWKVIINSLKINENLAQNWVKFRENWL